MIVMLLPDHGLVKKFEHPEPGRQATAEELASWAKTVAQEWRWLLHNSELRSLSPSDWEWVEAAEPDSSQSGHATSNETAGSHIPIGSLVNSTELWVVLLIDGMECPTCRNAKTNLLRLSASMVGLPVSCGVVDCTLHRDFCHGSQEVPASPFRPVLRLWPRGPKRHADVRGLDVFSPDELEPHVALRIMDTVIRAALAPDLQAGDALVSGLRSDFDDDKPDEKEDDQPQPPPQMPRQRDMSRNGLLWEGGRTHLPGPSGGRGGGGPRPPSHAQLQR